MDDNELKSLIIESPQMIATLDSALQCNELSNTWAGFADFERQGHRNLQISDLFEPDSQLLVEQRARIVLEKGENFIDLQVVVRGIEAACPAKLAMWRLDPIHHEALVVVLSLTFDIPTPLIPHDLGHQSYRNGPDTFANSASSVASVNASELERLNQRVDRLQSEIDSRYGTMVGTSNSIRRTLEQIETVAKTNASVLVTGEHGTGKEMIARAIHRASPRAAGPFVKLNCAAIAPDRFAIELFGTSRSAKPRARGNLWLADEGTLFLEHVSRIPLEVQVKLLQAMQLNEFERLGDGKMVPMNVRVIAANQFRLQKDVEEGRFFDDLYYRLSVFPIKAAPLRKRIEDILPLTKHFVKSFCRDLGRDRIIVTNQQIEQLRNLPWPGNVLELNSLLERAVLVSSGNHLRLDLVLATDVFHLSDKGLMANGGFLTETEFQALERRNIVAALRHAGWRISGPDGAAELLGVKPSTLTYRMKKHHIERD